MRISVFLICIVLAFSYSFAQTSKIECLSSGKGRDSMTYTLFYNHLLVDSVSVRGRVLFDSLTPGIYSLTIVYNKQKEMHEFKELVLGADSTIIINYDNNIFYQYTKDNKACKTRNCKDHESEFKLGYAPQFQGTNKALDHFESSLALKMYLREIGNSNWHIGPQYGLYFDYTNVDVKSSNANRVNYLNSGFEIGGQLRWSEIQKHPCKCDYSFLSLGITYKVPFYSRFVVITNQYKTIERYQHTLTNISGYVQAGYRPISVYAQYRPFNAINGDFPQPSPLSLGIRLNYSDLFD